MRSRKPNPRFRVVDHDAGKLIEETAKKVGLRVPRELLNKLKAQSRKEHRQTFAPTQPMPGVPKGAKLAMDSSVSDMVSWAAQSSFSSAFQEGMGFLGYAYLSILAQRPEFRVMSEEIASEMTREWIEFETSGGDDKADKI